MMITILISITITVGILNILLEFDRCKNDKNEERSNLRIITDRSYIVLAIVLAVVLVTFGRI